MKPRAGDRFETPLLPALLPSLLFHPSRRLPPSDTSSSRQTKKRRRKCRRTTAPFSFSLVPRRLSQTYKSNLREQIATEIPWRFQALFLFLLLPLFFCFYFTRTACASLSRLLPTSTHACPLSYPRRVSSLGSRHIPGKKQLFCSAFLILS